MINSIKNINLEYISEEMYQLMTTLYPICRSITGNGLRTSLGILQQYIPLQLIEVPSGTQVFDWTVPKEWNVHDAYLKNKQGKKVVDFQVSNLHLVNYSVPVKKTVSLEQLKEHLYSIPDQPDWIPYITSYYSENWGFCLQHRTLEQLEDGDYYVHIDTSIEDGHLTIGEFYLRGETEDEIVLTTHCCHPSMCNDNLSGMVVLAMLARQLAGMVTRYSYRFLFVPTTIGTISWLALNEQHLSNIQHGLVLASLGDPGQLTYTRSRLNNASIDKAMEYVLKNTAQKFQVLDFKPYGSDARQFCSPGFNLPVGTLTRTPLGLYPENHTSADNLDFVKPQYLADSLEKLFSLIDVLEGNGFFVNKNPKCEPKLGKRGLIGSFGGLKDSNQYELALLWILNLSDGDWSLLDIAERAGIPFSVVKVAADSLVKHRLLEIYKPS